MGKAVIIELFEGRGDMSLCLSDQHGDGYRLAGATMDGANVRVRGWELDADQLVAWIRETEYEKER